MEKHYKRFKNDNGIGYYRQSNFIVISKRFYFDVVMKKAHYNHIHKPLDVLPSKFKDIF